jgi:hypothetical protein
MIKKKIYKVRGGKVIKNLIKLLALNNVMNSNLISFIAANKIVTKKNSKKIIKRFYSEESIMDKVFLSVMVMTKIF